MDECEANKRKNDIVIVKLKRFLNCKSFLLTDPKDKNPISDISVNFNSKNWEKLFRGVFVDGHSIIDEDDISTFTIRPDFLTPV